MKSLNMVKRVTGITLAAVLLFSLTGCPKTERDRNVAIARDVASSLQAALPIIQTRNPELAKKLEKAIDAGGHLIDAIAASDSTQIAVLLRSILPVFNEIVRAYSNDSTVLIALALAQIGLNFFVNHFLPYGAVSIGGGMTAASPGDVDMVSAFLALPQFGCTYQPARCR